MHTTVTSCRVCGSKNLTSVMSLGEIAVSDFVDDPTSDTGVRIPLNLLMCERNEGGCGLVQLQHTVDSSVLYRTYWYQSGINFSMIEELGDIVRDISSRYNLHSNDIVIDIGSNDGTLLRQYDVKGLTTVGFEPAENLQQLGEQGTSKIIVDFFSAEAWRDNFGEKKAKVITAIGMFYDLQDPNKFVQDVADCLDDNGVFVVQMMYMPIAIEKNAFDGICHEHLEYYTLKSLDFLFHKHGLELFDCCLREHINEGSVRCFVRKKRSAESEVSNLKNALFEKEQTMLVNEPSAYVEFSRKIKRLRRETIDCLQSIKASGHTIHGYAASTKGNTTLQYYGIDSKTVSYIADRNPKKWGKFTVGSNIEIISEQASRDMKPDYYFVLAWHFLPEFMEREAEFLRRGGKFIVPMPGLKIIDA